MTRALPFALCALLAACGGGSSDPAPAPEPVTKRLPAPLETQRAPDCTVDLYGDSIMAGWYLKDMGLETPGQMLKRMRPAYKVNERAVGGEQAVQRAPMFDGGDSHFVVIEHGVNDAARGIDFAAALRSMVRQAKAEGRTVILTGLSQHTFPLDWVTAANELVRRVAAEEGATFADWLSVPHKGAGEMWDETHPGDVFTERLVVRLIEKLDQLAPECAS